MSQTVKSKSEWYEDLIRRSAMPLRLGMFPLRVYHYLQRKRREFCIILRDVFYIYVYTPLKVLQIRRKKKIKVLFLLMDVGQWKTELLYSRMISHERFDPVLGVFACAAYDKVVAESAKQGVVEYCAGRGYPFCDMDVDSAQRRDALAADIIFYQQPADCVYNDVLVFHKHLNALFCYALYAFHSVVVDWQINQPLFKFVWQNYFENDLTMQPLYAMRNFRRNNMVITGLPMSDALLKAKAGFEDPWRNGRQRKRIIYAPHCTISNQCKGVDYSTFLEYADDIRNLAFKYKDRVQWAFKPHPLLYQRLMRLWGKEKTDDYYNWWRLQEFTQFENGSYTGLFMYSDAMIHDCGSFTIEYHYTRNPVMYLLKGEGLDENLNEFAKMAFELHYKGRNLSDIESFIQNVVSGNDPKKAARNRFFTEKLIPPNGHSACDNIIDSILGNNGYK